MSSTADFHPKDRPKYRHENKTTNGNSTHDKGIIHEANNTLNKIILMYSSMFVLGVYVKYIQSHLRVKKPHIR